MMAYHPLFCSIEGGAIRKINTETIKGTSYGGFDTSVLTKGASNTNREREDSRRLKL